MKHTIKTIMYSLIFFLAVYLCIIFPREVGEGVNKCLWRCINVIIPSMFIFMCLTSAAVGSGLHNLLSVPFDFLSRYVFRLKSNQFGIMMLSMFSGYPAGIKLLTDCCRRNELNKEEFDRLSCFCFASGPAFISGVVSGILFPGTSAGMLCFISVTAGNIAAALVSGFFSHIPEKSSHKLKLNISANCIIESVLSSARGMFQMCAMIIAFGGVYKIAELSRVIDFASQTVSNITNTDDLCIKAVISSFLEISNIVSMPSSTGLLPVISALLSFGGICVLFQIIVISGGLLNVKKFLAYRLLAAIVSYFICRLISKFFSLGVVNVFAYKTFREKNDMLPAGLLLVMTIMLLSLFRETYRGDSDYSNPRK